MKESSYAIKEYMESLNHPGAHGFKQYNYQEAKKILSKVDIGLLVDEIIVSPKYYILTKYSLKNKNIKELIRKQNSGENYQ
jgi:hypothetical protein